jgi:hypothetical protein
MPLCTLNFLGAGECSCQVCVITHKVERAGKAASAGCRTNFAKLLGVQLLLLLLLHADIRFIDIAHYGKNNVSCGGLTHSSHLTAFPLLVLLLLLLLSHADVMALDFICYGKNNGPFGGFNKCRNLACKLGKPGCQSSLLGGNCVGELRAADTIQ